MNLETLTLPLDVADKGFKTAVAGAVAGATALVAAMGLAIKATFQWANDIDSLGDVIGGTNEELAAMAFIARKSGVGIETVTQANVILTKGLVKVNGELDTTGKKLKEYGINVKGVNGEVKTQAQLTDEIAAKYATLNTQQEKINFLTEIYGRNGAKMADFFDTLNSEGGIDAVTKKVKAFGLAIDPSRYEMFNRNLEEMKLIALGVAVGFTEKVMPMFENLASLVFTKVIPALKNFGSAITKAFQSGGLLGVVDFLLDAFDGIDWNAVSVSIAEGINSIDWQQVGIDFTALATRIKDSLVQLFGEIDLMVIGQSLGSALNNAIAGAFGVEGGEAGLQTLVQTKLAELTTEFQNWAAGAPSAFDALDQGIISKVTQLMSSLKTTIASGLANAKAAFVAWAAETVASLQAWGAGMVGHLATWGAEFVAKAIATLNTFEVTITNKLRDIAKAFFGAAQKWANQAAEGFLSNMGTILDAVSTVVGEINGILKKIITSFKLKFGGVDWGGNEPGGTKGGTNKPPLTNVTCFIAGTLVTLADGTQRLIEEMQEGDIVLSWHKGEYIKAKIKEVFAHPAEEAPALVCINGRLTATPDHLIYTTTGWKPAGKITTADVLLERAGELAVVSVDKIGGGFLPVYNLHTDHESHNYFANQILVHNSKDALPTADLPAFAASGNKAGAAQGVFILNWSDMDYPRLAGEIVRATNNA